MFGNKRNLLITLLLVLAVLSPLAFTRTAEEWKARSVYQIITDRFARTDGSSTHCDNLGKYCGGTFKGIENNLDYIQGMGFDAIWISPIVANTPDGYHGYWVSNLYEINEEFGTAEEMKELVQACHDRDIWVMVDIVANHIGYVDNFDYSAIVPFNSASHYNPYVDCGTINPIEDGEAYERCWLCGLPDLDQNNPFVRETLMSWISDLVQTYDIDGIRIDTIPHVSRNFWQEFSEASGVFAVGEVLNLDLHYLASYQGPLESILNYALYAALRDAFQQGKSMDVIQDYYNDAVVTWPDMSVLGNFINNHDNPRFLSNSTNVQGFKSGLAFTLSSVGIPMVYYGDEQAFNGGMDPANREPLWTDMNADSDIYGFLKTINKFRKESGFYAHDQIQRHSDDSFYAFTRGQYFFAFTNSLDPQVRTIQAHSYPEGTMLCSIFDEKDCSEVKNGEFSVELLNGEVKIFAPREPTEQDQPQKIADLEAMKLSMTTSSAVA